MITNKLNKLIVISENIKTETGSIISKLLVSPRGLVVAVVDNGSISSSFSNEWTIDYLNDLCEKYTFSNTMQASRIIDVMAERGFLSYEEKADFENNLAKGLKSINVVLISSAASPFLDSSSRRDFINRFSDLGGYECDELFEFISDIEGINGITVQSDGVVLNFMFSPEVGYSYPLLTMSSEQDRCDFYLKPSLLQSIIKIHNSDLDATASYIAYFASFCSGGISNYFSDRRSNDGFFADLPAVMSKVDEFVYITSRYINNLYKGA